MNKKIMGKLMEQKFTNKLVGLKTKEEAKRAFEEEGIKISDKQLNEVGREISEIVYKVSSLSQQDLEKISGGVLGLLEGMANTTQVPASCDPGWTSNPYALAAAGVGLLGIGAAVGKWWKGSNKTPPPPPQSVISDKALVAGAIVVAVVGGTYVLSKLKGSWFNNKK